MKNRAEKLESLKRRESIKTMQIFGNGQDFIDILEATVNNIKENLKDGVELKNIDSINVIVQASNNKMADLVWVTQEEFNQRGLDPSIIISWSMLRTLELNDNLLQ